MQTTYYNQKGQEAGKLDIPESLFGLPWNADLVYQVVLAMRSNERDPIAHTKTRGEVRGGGKKPWRQKGTGRARVGSSRSPIWRTGGVVFGPRKEQTWATRMPRTERRKALFSALSSKALNEQVIILEDWIMTTPKTKEVVALVGKLPIDQRQKVLHIHGSYDPILFSSTNNLTKVTSKTVQNMNILDIMNNDILLLTKESLNSLEAHFTNDTES